MVDNGVHRVYVYEPSAKPAVTGVVTPTDVLKLLVSLGLGVTGDADVGMGIGNGVAGMVLARPGGGVAKKARVDE